jgi:hypothetical protein
MISLMSTLLVISEPAIAEPVIAGVRGRQFGDLPNMIQPPLLGLR